MTIWDINTKIRFISQMRKWFREVEGLAQDHIIYEVLEQRF
jgi:hypothetical protein